MAARTPVIRGQPGFGEATAAIADIVLNPPAGRGWRLGFLAALALTLFFFYAIGYLFTVGVGIWGIDIPVAWGFAITNYVWWIGIGMAGTFISAALLLLRQPWRTSINRAAETMTVFAVGIAGLFPVMHLGRPWFFYWLFPYPDIMNLWPQWRSALAWDFYAILAYVVVSLLFWYTGMIPDLATLRDRARSRGRQVLYALFALGWRGEACHWRRHELASRLLAGIAVPLVFSVHSMVALDFSEGNTPGWHTTMFPPFFVAGALFSGFALVAALLIPLRRAYALDAYITERHLDSLGKALLASGLIIAYGYAMEVFNAWYSGDRYEVFTIVNRAYGPYAPIYWATWVCNVIIPQALWLGRVRRSPLAMFLISIGVLIGMWLERFVIVVTSLHRDFMPSAWGMFYPTFWDWAHLIGSVGLFLALFLVFLRVLPVLSMFELRRLISRGGGVR
jgi:Ni/Fe-hydrogenase subunit HybB-like protein